MRVYCKLWLFFYGVYLKVDGRENILKNQPFIICANHSSFLDIPCLYSMFNEYFIFTGKQEIEKWPLFHIFYTSGMNVLVDRKNKQGVLKGFKHMVKVLDEGFPLVIFPEGTISKKAPELGEFKHGALALAIKKQIPILPITFTCNWRRLQRSGFFRGEAGPGISGVVIHPAISTVGKSKEEVEALSEELKKIINTPLPQRCIV